LPADAHNARIDAQRESATASGDLSSAAVMCLGSAAVQSAATAGPAGECTLAVRKFNLEKAMLAACCLKRAYGKKACLAAAPEEQRPAVNMMSDGVCSVA
jgi:hypothetical protein